LVKVRVLVVSQYFWPENFWINAIVEGLVKREVEVDVLTGKPNYPEGVIFSGFRAWGCQSQSWKGAKLHRIPLFPRGRNSRLKLIVNYLSFVFFGLLSGSWMVRKHPYDAIFVYAPSPILTAIPALFIGWLKGIKVIIWVQDLWPESLSATGYIRNRYIIGAVGYVVRFIYRHADLLLVQSRAFEEPVRALAANTPIVYYPNSVDEIFALHEADAPPQVEGLGNGFSVLFAGNIGTAQAVEVIVEAALLLKKYADIHFIVLGDGSRREWMQQEVLRHKLGNLHLPGRFPIKSMPGFMQSASALLVTLDDKEVFNATIPNKVQAYLAAGRPILACLNGEGAKLVTAAGAGYAVPTQNGRALADAVLLLYRLLPEEREAMGARGRLYYTQHFAHNLLIDQLIGHLRSSCNY
jgi:glycosyltransferase involved in cell wall biosynthesis